MWPSLFKSQISYDPWSHISSCFLLFQCEKMRCCRGSVHMLPCLCEVYMCVSKEKSTAHTRVPFREFDWPSFPTSHVQFPSKIDLKWFVDSHVNIMQFQRLYLQDMPKTWKKSSRAIFLLCALSLFKQLNGCLKIDFNV